MDFDSYDAGEFFDEMLCPDGKPRPGTEALVGGLRDFPLHELRHRQSAAEVAFLNMGITFGVNGDAMGRERVFPFDLIPRVVRASEWAEISRGLEQRVRALNAFVDDVYHGQRIVRDGVVPGNVISSSKGFLPQCVGLDPPLGTWCHVSGIDLVRDGDGRVFVLEDNVRCPSGVSYVLENRQVAKQVFPEVFERAAVEPVITYPVQLLETLRALSTKPDPTVVVLTPGTYNSAYFEHSYLAQKMGVELVEGSDLVVVDDEVRMRTTRGLQRVDVIYRRINDDFLDPEVFREDSALGVPGLMRAYQKGNVALANAPGTGVADDKGVYPYVPDIVRYYLKEEPILPNVPTYRCWEKEDCDFVLQNLDSLVVKSANEAGGYGMLMGPHATQAERDEFATLIERDPRNYVAQPVLALSRVPTLVDAGVEGRHVDLRPYVLFGRDVWVMPGGLTRVALRKGSLVVNSSQGGGSKDTWVVRDDPAPAPAREVA